MLLCTQRWKIPVGFEDESEFHLLILLLCNYLTKNASYNLWVTGSKLIYFLSPDKTWFISCQKINPYPVLFKPTELGEHIRDRLVINHGGHIKIPLYCDRGFTPPVRNVVWGFIPSKAVNILRSTGSGSWITMPYTSPDPDTSGTKYWSYLQPNPYPVKGYLVKDNPDSHG